MGRHGRWGHRQLYAILLGMFLCQLLVPLPVPGQVESPERLGPQYDIDAFYVPTPGIAVDGNLSETAWSDPNVTVATTGDFNGYSLTIKVFHNDSYLFVGVMMWGDTSPHPNDFCHICFDVDNDGAEPPEDTDLKLVARGTAANPDISELYYGDGAGGWSLFSNKTGTLNEWPAGFAADAEMQGVATYEFQIPVEEVWGTPSPWRGLNAGFIVHAHTQGTNKQHVWWPDNGSTEETPDPEYCDFASGYGNVLYNGQFGCRALMAYFDNSNPEIPRNRTWNGTAWGAEHSAVPTGADANYWFDLEACPVRTGEAILATSDAGNDLNVQEWNGSAWVHQLELIDTAPSTAYRSFDLAYESASGNAMLAYYNMSAGDSLPKYRTWDGTVWSAENAALAGNVDDINWIALASHPTTDEILMVTLDAADTLHAQVWDGAAWGNGQLLDSDVSRSNMKCFDVTYEQQSGYGFVAWGGDTTNNRNINHRRWKGDWTEPGSLLFRAPGQVNILEMASDPRTNHILIGDVAQTNQMNFTVWDGGAVGTSVQVNNAPRNTERVFDVAWEAAGTTEGLVVYGIQGQTVPRYRTVSGNVVSATEQTALDANPGTSYPNWVMLKSDPYSGDIMLTYLSDAPGNNVDFIGAELWNGTADAWGFPQNVETNADRTHECFDVVWLPGEPVPDPDHIVYVSGDDQAGHVGTNLALPIVFRVDNATGVPAPGQKINFMIYDVPVGATDYYFVESGQPWYNDTSDSNGHVSALLHLGSEPGNYSINVSSSLPGNPTYNDTINATATLGSLASIEISANPAAVQVTGNGALTIWANDSMGSGISNLTVNLGLDANNSGAALGPVTDNYNGTYSCTYTAGQTAWVTDRVNATSGLFYDTADIDVLPGAVDNVDMVASAYAVITGGNSDLTIWVNDTYGNGVPYLTVDMTFDVNASAPGEGVTTPATDIGYGVYGSVYTAGSTGGVMDTVRATESGTGYFDTVGIDVDALPLHTIEVSANLSQVMVQNTALITIWANDTGGYGVEGLEINVTFEYNPSVPDAGLITPASDIGGGVYTSVYTAGKTADVTDIVNASFGTLGNSIEFLVKPGPLASIEIAASPGTVPVTGGSTLTIWANDSYDNGLAGLVIDLDFDANPSAPGETVTTPAFEVGNGVYTSTYTAGETPEVTDTVLAWNGTVSNTVDIHVITGPPATLSISANVSTVRAGGTVNLTVWANDSVGNPVSGLTITMGLDDDQSGAGFGAVHDNGNGTYNCIYTAGQTGDVTDIVNASYSGLWATLGIDVTVPPVLDIPNISILSGDGQGATAGTLLPEQLIVVVRNQTGAAMANVNVWFNVTYGGGNVGSANPATNVQGQAGTNLTLGLAPGLNTVTAEISTNGTGQVTFVAMGTLPELAAHLEANATKVVAGSTFVYILSYDNVGDEPAADLWVNDTLPDGIEYVSDGSGSAPVVNGLAHSWHLTDVGVGSHSFVMLCRLAAGTAAGTELANHFTVDYTDRAGRPRPTASSNTVTVETLAEAIQNTPPVIEGVPDLVVHYNWDYQLDLSPYITDPDDEPTELTVLLSDTVNARVDTADNLVIVLNYSAAYVGAGAQPLNITVSDGYGSDWDTIRVTVTDDFPPEKLQALPDVTMSEDRVAYPFNITEYFFDRDGDAIFYTYGERHINVTFMWNQTVRLIPVENWFGSERITFRAKSGGLGALVEDTITVTVLPVNDPPTVSAIPDQEGEVNVTWVLDLSPYLADIDNDLSDLIITTDSGSVIANGLNLTFRFTTPVEADIVTVTISDGEAQVYGQISVTVTAPAPPPIESDGFPIPWWVFLLIFIPVVIVGILLATRKKAETLIEQAFLINKDGSLLAHVTSHLIPEMDSEIFSSMLTAIQDFVKDSFKDESRWELNKLEFGENKIFVHRARSGLTTLALVYKGDDEAVKAKAQKILDEVDHFFGDVLKDWDGNRDAVRGVKDVLREHLSK